MLQYLINITAIWLLSLLVFDIFLKRESYHGYNRFYLLFTFLLGALLPLWQWQEEGKIHVETLQVTMQQVVTARQNIEAAVLAEPNSPTNWAQWVTIVYMAGVVISCFMLIVEIVKLTFIYRNGKKSYKGSWTIIETGKEHGPFSISNILFVNSRDLYSPEEWNMICIHEERHSRLLHFADLALMQIARILFWFHPLTYVYNKRLLLVHEYQADAATIVKPQVYGQFLLSQVIFQTPPSIVHSFNRSPIKKRIVMLSNKPTVLTGIKTFVLIPLVAVCLMCFSKNAFSQKKQEYGKAHLIGPGTSDTGIRHVTYDQILANPGITSKERDYKITEFKIYFVPVGKFISGPYTIKGDKLKGEALDKVKEFKGSESKDIRIIIDDVLASHNGKVEKIVGQTYVCGNK